MVDPVNSAGQIANIKSVQAKPVAQVEEKSTKNVDKKDEIVISDEALSLQQAEQNAKKASAYLAGNSLATLSTDANKLSALV